MMKKKLVLLCLISIIFLTSCSHKGSIKDPVETEDLLMGTVISQRVYGSNAKAAADEVSKRLKQINDKMTVNSPGGEVNDINAQAGIKSVQTSADTFFLIKTALKYSSLTGGAFDVTIGPLVKAWGIFTDNPRIPGQADINRLKGLINYKDILLDEKNRTVKLLRSGQSIDLGGIAKGYAGDEAIHIYKAKGIKSAYINLGGNVVVLGKKPDGSLWRIGIQDPRSKKDEYVGILSLSDKAVVTSGDYERYFEKNGKRYHHILDPKTGYPSESGLISTTIVTASSTDADALSTSTFILGLEKGMELVKSLPGVEAIFITSDKKIYVTPGLNDSFEFNSQNKGYSYDEKG